MLILPDGHYAPKVLPPQPRDYWNPSLSLPRDGLGNPVVEQYWRLTARLHDGHIVWRGRFDDRDDADAFLFALFTGSLQQEPALWRLPTPAWHPGIGELLEYDFSTLRSLTGTSTSTQTDTVPSDWGNVSNSIEIVSHAGTSTSGANGGAGAGGGYAKAVNVSLTQGASATYRLAPAGNGNDDAHADWYNGATLAASSVGIRGGANSSGSTGGAGASTTNAIGSTKFAGGNGGNGYTQSGCCDTSAAGGGGGAAGTHGAGSAGNTASSGADGSGGNADNGTVSGGSAGAGGSSGTEFDASHGSGAGGGGNGFGTGGSGGVYGGAAGAGVTAGTSQAGLIFQIYTPAAPGGGLLFYVPTMFIA